MKQNLLLFILFLLVLNTGIGQTFPIGFNSIDEKLRDLQLQGKLNKDYSFLNRPYNNDNVLSLDTAMYYLDSTFKFNQLKYTLSKKNQIKILPTSIITRYNSHHPYGFNQQGFIDAKGFQNYLSSGFYIKYGIIDVQFLPELIYATNPNFEISNQYGSKTKGPYQKALLGQSFIRLSSKKISLSLSTENRWWGPGIKNSLIMSNNAPGFMHLAINSKAPIKTPIGNIEFTILGGKLIQDTNVLLEVKNLKTFYYAQGSYIGEPSVAVRDTGSWRYVNSINIVYNPIFAPSLFLSFNRVGYAYNTYMATHNNFIQDYLPVFNGIFRSTSKHYTSTGENTKTKQLVSLAGRYVFQKSHAEIYAEYGIGDNTYNLRDFALSVDHGAIFTVGFKKLTQLENKKWLDIEAEMTNLTQSFNNRYRGTGGDWYLYQGSYTNQGRIIGAGFGMNSLYQFYKASIKNNLNEKGIFLERIVYNTTLEPNYSLNKKWVDYSLGYIYQKRYNNMLIQARCQFVFADNYAWKIDAKRVNFNSQIGLLYFISKKHDKNK